MWQINLLLGLFLIACRHALALHHALYHGIVFQFFWFLIHILIMQYNEVHKMFFNLLEVWIFYISRYMVPPKEFYIHLHHKSELLHLELSQQVLVEPLLVLFLLSRATKAPLYDMKKER